MPNFESTSSSQNPDRLSPDQRREFLKAAQASKRITQEDRVDFLKHAQQAQAEDAARAAEIAGMIAEHITTPEDAVFPLRADEFSEKNNNLEHKSTSVDLTAHVNKLSDIEEARKIYEMTKAREKLN